MSVRTSAGRRLSAHRWELVVFAAGLCARLAVVGTSGGFTGDYGYDPSVYFAAADAMTHGRLPYRDFVLLHPPLLSVLLVPFALLGRLTTDVTGWAVGSIAFAVLGAVNATLVVRVARRLGATPLSAVAGGLVYALWLGAVRAEFTTRLEPLGNAFLLLALLALAPALRTRSSDVGPRTYLLAGVALGAAASVKIWFSVPLVVLLLVVVLIRRSARASLLVAAGAAVTGLVVDGPFLLLSHGRMWSMVVLQQLGRHRTHIDALDRMRAFTGLAAMHGSTAQLFIAVLVAIGVWLVARALATGAGRVVLALLGAQLIVVLAAPSWFSFYADYLAPGFALLVGCATSTSAPRVARRIGPLVGVAAAVVALLSLSSAMDGRFVAVTSVPHRTALAAAASRLRCITSDSPSALIELNALDRSFEPGCVDWVDVTGRTYGVDSAPTIRRHNRKWQRDFCQYLLSGQAFVLVRDGWTEITDPTMDIVARGGVIAGRSGDALYRSSGRPSECVDLDPRF